jgi:hypothetical protein
MTFFSENNDIVRETKIVLRGKKNAVRVKEAQGK